MGWGGGDCGRATTRVAPTGEGEEGEEAPAFAGVTKRKPNRCLSSLDRVRMSGQLRCGKFRRVGRRVWGLV